VIHFVEIEMKSIMLMFMIIHKLVVSIMIIVVVVVCKSVVYCGCGWNC
jgi:hypothetical protein